MQHRHTSCAFYAEDVVGEGETHDLSLVTYVDDLLKMHVVPDGKCCTAERLLRRSNTTLDRALAPFGMAQNTDKQEVVPHLTQRTQNRLLHTSTRVQGRVLKHARHLGGRFDPSGSNVAERNARVAAIRLAWSQLGSWWHVQIPWRLRCMF